MITVKYKLSGKNIRLVLRNANEKALHTAGPVLFTVQLLFYCFIILTVSERSVLSAKPTI